MTEIQSMDEGDYYIQESGTNKILRVKLDYSSYEILDVYHETDPNTVIKNFELDASQKLYMLNRYKVGKTKRLYLKIYNIE